MSLEQSFSQGYGEGPLGPLQPGAAFAHMGGGKQSNYRPAPTRSLPANKSAAGKQYPTAADGKDDSAFASSLFSVASAPVPLPNAPAIALPSVTLPTVDVHDARAAERGWRNIPEAVRDSVASLADAVRGLHAVTQALHGGLQRRAGTAEVATALSGRASQEQLSTLARFVQRDVLGRLEQPCPAHAAGARSVAQLTARIGALEAVVSAQDSALTHLQKELSLAKGKGGHGGGRGRGGGGRGWESDGEAEEEGIARSGKGVFITAEALEARLAAFQSSLLGNGVVATPAALQASAGATLQAVKDHVNGQMAGKADAAVVRALASDVEMLADSLVDVRQAAHAASAASAGQSDAVESLSATLDEVRVQVQGLKEEVASMKDPVSAASRSAKRVGSSGPGPGHSRVLHGGSPGPSNVYGHRGSTGAGQQGGRYMDTTVTDGLDLSPPESGLGASAAGVLPPATKAAVAAVAESLLRSKMTILTTSIERQVSTARQALGKEVEDKFTGLREEVLKEVKSRPVKSEVLRLVSGKTSVEAVREVLAAELSTAEAGLKRRIAAEVGEMRAEVAAVRRLAVDAATQAQIGHGLGSAGSGSGADGGMAGPGPTGVEQVRTELAQLRAALMDASALAEARLKASLAADVEAAVASVRATTPASAASRLRVRHQDVDEEEEEEEGLEEAGYTGRRAGRKDRDSVDAASLRPTVTALAASLSSIQEQLSNLQALQALQATTAAAGGAAAGPASKGGIGGGAPRSPGRAQQVAAPIASSPAQELALSLPPVVSSATNPQLAGRWVWKNRRLTPSSVMDLPQGMALPAGAQAFATRCVLWDVQAVNTGPELLLWGTAAPADSSSSKGANPALNPKSGKDKKGRGDGGEAAAERGNAQGKDEAVVVAVKSGLYRLSLGFFSLVPPALTVLVDGLPVLSTQPPVDTAVPGPGLTGSAGGDSSADSATGLGLGHSKLDVTDMGSGIGRAASKVDRGVSVGAGAGGAGRGVQERVPREPSSLNTTAILEGTAGEGDAGLAPTLVPGIQIGGGPVIHRHPAGSVAGVTVLHFLALPARARISVRYEGPTKGQGFMELAKL